MMRKKYCPCCGNRVRGHPNKKFCGKRCKDKYHNYTNPRGYYQHLNPDSPDYDVREHEHPFSSEALGQS